MKIRYLHSFVQTLESLPGTSQARTVRSLSKLLDFLEKKSRSSGGLRVRKLRKGLWESRVDIKVRILFTLEPGLITFVLVGDHNHIKRYLKR